MEPYKKTVWTEHSKIKMKQYGLSQQKLLNVLHKPERKEIGIVPGTLAVMKTNKKFVNSIWAKQEKTKSKWGNLKKAPGEIWLMYKDVKSQNSENFRKIISAWRYPGISKPGEEIPIPKDIREELLSKNGQL